MGVGVSWDFVGVFEHGVHEVILGVFGFLLGEMSKMEGFVLANEGKGVFGSPCYPLFMLPSWL